MSKGSKRRPGKGYEDRYDKIFKKPEEKKEKEKPKCTCATDRLYCPLHDNFF